MTTTIQNQFGKYIVCEPQFTEILNMVEKGRDSQVIEGNLVEIVKSFRKDGEHQVTVKVHS